MEIDWRKETNAPAPGTLVCDLDELEAGGIREFLFGEQQPFRLVVYRNGNGIFGYVNQCPHHWLPMNGPGKDFLFWKEDEIMCVHHSAVFNLASGGHCSMGPCQGSNLTTVPLRVINGKVVIKGACFEGEESDLV